MRNFREAARYGTRVASLPRVGSMRVTEFVRFGVVALAVLGVLLAAGVSPAREPHADKAKPAVSTTVRFLSKR